MKVVSRWGCSCNDGVALSGMGGGHWRIYSPVRCRVSNLMEGMGKVWDSIGVSLRSGFRQHYPLVLAQAHVT